MTTHRATQPISAPRPAVDEGGSTSAPDVAGGHFAGFLKLNRTDTTRELLRDPKAFTLLAGIAFRAKWSNCLSVHNLEPGQALIGDHRSFGLTPKEYRLAKARLSKWQLAAFQGTNKGTVATLINTDVFDIFGSAKGEQEGRSRASQGQTKGEPRATNEEGKTGEERKEGGKGPRIFISELKAKMEAKKAIAENLTSRHSLQYEEEQRRYPKEYAEYRQLQKDIKDLERQIADYPT